MATFMASKYPSGSKSSDDYNLKFENNETVDAHEFGHAYDLLTGAKGNLRGPDKTWRSFENSVRERNPQNKQRRKEH